MADKSQNNEELSAISAGLDVGSDSIRLVVNASDGNSTAYTITNVAIKLPKTMSKEVLVKRFRANFVEINNSLYIIGKDSLKLHSIFPNSRIVKPVVNGMINPKEPDALQLISTYIKRLINDSGLDIRRLVYTVLAPSVDNKMDIDYHRSLIEHILESSKINEIVTLYTAQAAAYNDLLDDNITGIIIDCGHNITNVCFSYLDIPAVNFSYEVGAEEIENAISSNLNCNPMEARRLVDVFSTAGDDSDLSVQQLLAIRASIDSYCSKILGKLEEVLLGWENGIVYDQPVKMVLTGGAFTITPVVKGLKDGLTQVIRSTTQNKIKDTVVATRPILSPAIGACTTSDYEDLTTAVTVQEQLSELDETLESEES